MTRKNDVLWGAMALLLAGCSVGGDPEPGLLSGGALPPAGTDDGAADDDDDDDDDASEGGEGTGGTEPGDDESSGGLPDDGGSTGEPWEPDPNGPAFLHADLWSTWWNDRTRCGAETTFLEICQRRGEADCGSYAAAVAACNPNMIVNGQVGPEQQGNELCSRGPFPDIGGCVASQYDFDALRFWWYGAEWQGNWPVATLKLFPQGADWTGGGELVAMSNLPGHGQAAMNGIDNHGLGYGCTMPGATSGDEAYESPFGAFAWVEVPTDQAVTVVVGSATNFADQDFQGCSRGAATQDPWITDAPGSVLGCVYTIDFQFEPGHHYYLRYGQIVELDQPLPPQEIIDAFAGPDLGLDVTTEAACAL